MEVEATVGERHGSIIEHVVLGVGSTSQCRTECNMAEEHCTVSSSLTDYMPGGQDPDCN